MVVGDRAWRSATVEPNDAGHGNVVAIAPNTKCKPQRPCVFAKGCPWSSGKRRPPWTDPSGQPTATAGLRMLLAGRESGDPVCIGGSAAPPPPLRSTSSGGGADVIAMGKRLAPSAAHFSPVLTQWVGRKHDCKRLHSLSRPRYEIKEPRQLSPTGVHRALDEERLAFLASPRAPYAAIQTRAPAVANHEAGSRMHQDDAAHRRQALVGGDMPRYLKETGSSRSRRVEVALAAAAAVASAKPLRLVPAAKQLPQAVIGPAEAAIICDTPIGDTPIGDSDDENDGHHTMAWEAGAALHSEVQVATDEYGEETEDTDVPRTCVNTA
eukprot:TRINITY_DN63006_c0_g1_i1.p1 TRINITY_DN63006_c0_g1~~TRINITY_DN63006_c0_g1_i1.p1  ORF type:complete len:324 (+),score=46.13 TRINITY_DN63006_c0_g1_i1:92-1063(+)